jgi:hypothetical protein
MHPVLAVALGMFGAVALVRWCAKEVRRVNAGLDGVRASGVRSSVDQVDRNALPKLKRDPVTGEYRPG